MINKFIFTFASLCLFVSAETTDISKLSKLEQSSFKLLEKSCLSCHGEVVDGKAKIKGDFDLVPLLQTDNFSKHTAEWMKIIEQIESGEMPPEKKAPLTKSDMAVILSPVKDGLYKSSIPERMIASHEMQNSASKLYNYNKESFDPFHALHYLKNPEAKFPTHDNFSILSANYLTEITKAYKSIYDYYLSQKLIKYPKKVTEAKKYNLWIRGGGPNDSTEYISLDQKKLKDLEKAYKAKEIKKAKYVGALQNERRQNPRLDFLGSFRSELRILEGTGLLKNSAYLPGHYRLTFTAEARNRKFIQNAYKNKQSEKKSKQSKNKKKVASPFGRDLANEKALLTIYHQGQAKSNATPHRGEEKYLVNGSKSGRILHRFYIEDDVEKVYTCEFTLTEPARLGIAFENGPNVARRKQMNFGSVKMKNFKGPDDHPFPRVIINSKIVLERIKPIGPINPFEMMEQDNEENYIDKLAEMMEQLKSPISRSYINGVYTNLPDSMDDKNRYFYTLNHLMLKAENLFINYESEDMQARARFLSYALLKTHPDESFINTYTKLMNESLSAKSFASYIVKRPEFEDFLSEFNKYWLENFVELDVVKYKGSLRTRNYDDLTDAYVKYLFQNNRPVKELYVSDYQVMDRAFGMTYEPNNKAVNKLKRDDYEKIKVDRGGVLNQPAFFIAQSDGLDPLPFKRANWISEKIFDQKLSTPPDVDSEVFNENIEGLSFEEVAKIHSKNKGCASCHNILDPIASAFLHVDVLGRKTFMDQYNEQRAKEFESRLQKQDRVIARSYTKELISYIIGRESNLYDLKRVDQILNATKSSNYAAQNILAEIVKVYFQKKG